MDVFAQIRAGVLEALGAMERDGEIPPATDTAPVTVSPPRDEAHGEMATNAALVLARRIGQDPRALADTLAGRLRQDGRIRAAESAGAGFVNLWLEPGVWLDAVQAALRQGVDFGRAERGCGQRVNVEFVSANPTGPLHVGHARGAVYGDALASLLAFCGDSVWREYYINDAGAQVDTLARSAHLRYRQALGEDVVLPDNGYGGAYLVPVGKALAETFGDRFRDAPESAWLAELREFTVAEMMQEVRADLAAVGVGMDGYVSERALQESGRVERTVAGLATRGLIYQGTLARPKGAAAEDWEPREQTLFRSTEYGDDTDRPLRKVDGSWTYFAPDIAYHADKIERGFDTLIDVWGEDHGGYVRRMRAAVAALSEGRVALDVRICRTVRLLRDGAPVAMSKRRGEYLLLRELVEEVGADVVRFVLLTRKNDAALDFDLARIREQSRDNPVFYVHYAHARACSALRRAAEHFGAEAIGDDALAGADLSAIDQPALLALARRVAGWPSAVATAARAHEPHRVSYYLQAVAADLHGLWTAGKSEASLRLVQEDDPAGSHARLAVVRAAAIVIAAGFGILGIQPRQEMR